MQSVAAVFFAVAQHQVRPHRQWQVQRLDRHQSKPCATAPCPVTCILATSFGEWGPCSEVCGSGKQHRLRQLFARACLVRGRALSSPAQLGARR